jgi:hypothetical protein
VKHAKWLVTVLLALLGGTAMWAASPFRKSNEPTADGQASAPKVITEGVPSPSPVDPARGVLVTRTSETNLRQKMKEATDYFALAQSILPRARGGDAAAQYYLWAIHLDCYESGTGAIAEDNGRPLGWDEAVQKATRLKIPIEQAAKDYERCHRFFSEDVSALGDPMQWLQRATDAQYPPAQAETARLRLLQDQLKSFQHAGAATTGYAALPPIGGQTTARDLVRSAVKSLDPTALQQVAYIISSLDPKASPEDARINRIAWLYVSCQRGADCSVFGESSMLNCLPEEQDCFGVPEGLLKMTNNDWAPVQTRANEINAALENRQWDKLGLGDPSS